jgi:hypothetical protein
LKALALAFGLLLFPTDAPHVLLLAYRLQATVVTAQAADYPACGNGTAPGIGQACWVTA